MAFRILFCSLLLATSTISKAGKFPFEFYSVHEGLPQASVFDIMQDSHGYLWIATDGGGVARFDGKDFFVLNKSTGLSGNIVRCMYEDKSGKIWFGTDQGLCWYDGHKMNTLQKKINFSGSVILSIMEDKAGNIWASTNDGGINQLIISNGKITQIKNYSKKNGLSSNFVMNAEFDKQGKLWLAMIGGVNVLAFKKDTFNVTFLEKGFEIPSDFITKIIHGDTHEMVCASYDQGIFTISNTENPKNNKCVSDPNISSIATRIWSINYQSPSTLWIGSDENGLVCKEKSKLKIFDKSNGFQNSPVMDILVDKRGAIWLATMNNGIARFIGEHFCLYDEKDGLPSNSIHGIARDFNGGLMVGGDFGLMQANIKGNRIVSFLQINKNIKVTSLCNSPDSALIIGTQNDGVLVYRNGKLTKKINTTNGLRDNQINCVEYDNHGFLWVGTKNGVEQISDKKSNFHFNEENGLIHNEVQTLLADSKGRLWMGTLGGLAFIKDGGYTDFDEVEGLTYKKIHCLAEDKKGRIWIGTFGGGIFVFDDKQKGKKKIKNILNESLLHSNNIYSLQFLNDSLLLAGTDKGLCKVLLKDETIIDIHYYDKSNGYLGIENNLNAICVDKEDVWFGTINGLMQFRPSEEPLINNYNNLQITDIQLFNEKVDWNARTKFKTDWYGLPDMLKLNYKDNHITFFFHDISLKDAGKTRYSYFMEGIDKKWSNASFENKATYTGISDGEYIFHVRSIDENNVQGNEVLYEVTINPPFWKTWWFYTIVIILLLLSVWTYVKWQTAKLKRDNIRLERIVEERTEEIKLQRDEIQEQKQELTDSIEYAKKIQNAVMPGIEQLNQIFPENFILFKPRDIVSGDFYWFGEKDGKCIVTVADCTGHGVPGAFMSMLGIRFLNEIVLEKGITRPDEILNHLREKIIQAMRQRGIEGENKDGMDITLCSIDVAKRVLQFAGAYNPLLWISNHEPNELKADKMPIAIYYRMDTFSLHEKQYQPGDCIYLSSDGYADQFGGENQKKFKSSAYRAMLLENHQKSFAEQLQIVEDSFMSWKGSYEQIDDVTVMGIRLI